MPGDWLVNDAGVSMRRWGQSTVRHVTWWIRTAVAETPFSAHLRWITYRRGWPRMAPAFGRRCGKSAN